MIASHCLLLSLIASMALTVNPRVSAAELVTRLPAHKDGDVTLGQNDNIDWKLEVGNYGRKSVAWITFQTGGSDPAQASGASLTLSVEGLHQPGTLKVYLLTSPIGVHENQVGGIDWSYNPNAPIASIPLTAANEFKIIRINLGQILCQGAFHGVVLGSTDGLKAYFGSKDSDIPPSIELRYPFATGEQMAQAMDWVAMFQAAADAITESESAAAAAAAASQASADLSTVSATASRSSADAAQAAGAVSEASAASSQAASAASSASAAEAAGAAAQATAAASQALSSAAQSESGSISVSNAIAGFQSGLSDVQGQIASASASAQASASSAAVSAGAVSASASASSAAAAASEASAQAASAWALAAAASAESVAGGRIFPVGTALLTSRNEPPHGFHPYGSAAEFRDTLAGQSGGFPLAFRRRKRGDRRQAVLCWRNGRFERPQLCASLRSRRQLLEPGGGNSGCRPPGFHGRARRPALFHGGPGRGRVTPGRVVLV